jgi:hypothetical protein
VTFEDGKPIGDESLFSFEGPGISSRKTMQNYAKQEASILTYKKLTNTSVGDTGSGWPYRPSGLAFTKTAVGESLLISSDSNGEIVAVARTS